MSGAMYETDNKSIGSFPSINLESENLTYISHYHEEMEVIYIKCGVTSAYSGSNEIVLQKGDICIFMPGEIHSFQSTEYNCIDILKLKTDTFYEEIDFWKMRLKNNRISCDHSCYQVLKSVIDEIRNEFKEQKTGYEFAIRNCKNIIISTVIRNIEHEYSDQSKSIMMLDLINKYLELNFESHICLDGAAKACHFSKYYFAHKLKELTGTTFVQYLSSFRAEKAAQLLKTTNMRVTDVALKCGFNNLRSFNRQFKATYNVTPLMYRKSVNNNS